MSAEGVFVRQDATAQGELVDRLMAKIAELETKLYERDLASNQQQLIPAATCKPGLLQVPLENALSSFNWLKIVKQYQCLDGL
jgi:hypothetical protein